MTVTYDFREFMSGNCEEEKKRRSPLWSLAPFVPGPIESAYAADQTIQAKMMTAFDPLIELIQGLAYPVALSVVLGGAIMFIFGNSEKGLSMMGKAAVGYVLCMLLPSVFEILVSAMAGVM